MHINELDNYDLNDAIRFHSRLNPGLWNNREHIKPEVREALLKIADDFREFLGVPDLQVKDITVSGSNASYSYTPNSDIDLHLVVEIPELYDPVYRELFNAKKFQYNEQNNIRVRNADVELYVQPADEPVISQGEYSLKNDRWIQVPRRRRAEINDSAVQNKYEYLKQRIENAIEAGEGAEALMKKIRAMRQAGLDEHGEFSPENLAFKMLRSQGYIERLAKARSDEHSRELSLDERRRGRRKKSRRTYGYGGYWFPGFAYAGQDHPAGTEGEGGGDGGGESVQEGFADNLYKSAQAVAMAGAMAMSPAAAQTPAPEPITIAYVTINGETKKFELGDRFKTAKEAEKFVSDVLDRQGLEGTYSIDIRRGVPKQPTQEDVGHTWDGVSPSTMMFASEDVGHTWDGVSASTTMFTSEDTDEDRTDIIKKFTQHAARHLGLKPLPRIHIIRGTDWSTKNNSFGRYVPDEKTLYIAIDNRHILDVLRTLAHELTHAHQDQHNKLNDKSGETGSPEENQANARAGIIMRDFAAANPEYFGAVKESLETRLHRQLCAIKEASGYIPSEAEKDDPRFEMALSVDIHPDTMQKNAAKLGWQIARDGTPPLLRESQETDLFEVKMTTKNLMAMAKNIEALVGIEFEVYVPGGAFDDEDEFESEPDWEANEGTETDYRSWVRQMRQFWAGGQMSNSRNTIDRVINNIDEEFSNWKRERFDDLVEEGDDYVIDLILDELKKFIDQEDDESGSDYIDRLMGEISQKTVTAKECIDEAFAEWSDDEDHFSDFIEDNDYGTMAGIYQSWDSTLEWPYWTEDDGGRTTESAAWPLEDIAESFSAAVGMPVNYSHRYHGCTREEGKWCVEPDSSVDNPEDAGDMGLEFISPKMPLSQWMQLMPKVMKWFGQHDCYTKLGNAKEGTGGGTGMHMNVSVKGFKQSNLDYIKLALFLGDEYVANQFQRLGAWYAKSATENIAKSAQSSPQRVEELFKAMRDGLSQVASRNILSPTSVNKYTSINPKERYVEFRSPGGDYIGEYAANPDKIWNSLLRMIVALDIASDPAKEREEYARKLNRLLKPTKFAATKRGERQRIDEPLKANVDDTIKLFSKWAAGELPKSVLKNFVRKVQSQRVTKTGASNTYYEWEVRTEAEPGARVTVIGVDESDAILRAKQEKPNWVNAPTVDFTATARKKVNIPWVMMNRNNPGQKTEVKASSVSDARERAAEELESGVAHMIGYPNIPDYGRPGRPIKDWWVWPRHGYAAGIDVKAPTEEIAKMLAMVEYPDQFGSMNFDDVMAGDPNQYPEAHRRMIQQPGSEVGGEQSTDANYEIVNRETVPYRPVFRFIANTDQEASQKYLDWLAGNGIDEDTETFGWRRIEGRGIPGSSVERARERAGGFDRAPHSAIFSIIDNRDGVVLWPGQQSTWVHAQTVAQNFRYNQAIPPEDIRIIDMENNRAYLISGARADAASAPQEETHRYRVDYNYRQRSDQPYMQDFVFRDAASEHEAEQMVRRQLAAQGISDFINVEARMAQTVANPQGGRDEGAEGNEQGPWAITYIPSNRVVQTLTGTRSTFSQARTAVMDLADNSIEPHSYEDYAIRNVTNGRTYDYHGDLISTSQPQTPSRDQEFTGTWEVVSRPTDEVVYTLHGIGNAVADAERYAETWARRTGFDDPVYVRPVMRPRESAEYVATLRNPEYPSQQLFRFNSSYPVANYDQAVAVLRVALRDQGYSVGQIDNLRVVSIETGDHRFTPPEQTLELPLFNVRWTDDYGHPHDVNTRAPNANAAMDRIRQNLEQRGLGVRSIEANPLEQTSDLPPGNVRWRILDPNDREVYSFVHRANQREANAYAMQWLRLNGILGSGEFMVVPVT